MKPQLELTLDPALDLRMTRETHVPVELVWKAWTTPDLLMQWFCPKPWSTVECDLDLYPGGQFRTVMQSPEGEKFPGTSCVLEVVENQRLVWTSALLPGYRPIVKAAGSTEPGAFTFTAIIQMDSNGAGTSYSATVVHGDEEARKQHAEMGFETGWGAAFDQLVALMS